MSRKGTARQRECRCPPRKKAPRDKAIDAGTIVLHIDAGTIDAETTDGCSLRHECAR